MSIFGPSKVPSSDISVANTDIYKRILEYKNINLIASGGIASITDIRDLVDIGSHECVVGKAIYENKITLPELQNVN